LKMISLLFRDESILEVTSVVPKNQSTKNFRNTNVFIGFNKNVYSFSKEQIKITSFSNQELIEGVFINNGKYVVFTPNTNFLANTTYLISILAENGLNKAYEFQFSTGSEIDNVPPTILSTSPESGEINFPINANIVVNFNEVIDPTSITGNNFALQGNPPGSLSIQNQSLSFKPASNLIASNAYIAIVRNGIKDLAGNQMSNNYSWVFSTSEFASSTCTYDIGIFGLCLFE